MTKFDQKLDFPNLPSEADVLNDINDALADAAGDDFHGLPRAPSKPTLEDTKRLFMDLGDEPDDDMGEGLGDELRDELSSEPDSEMSNNVASAASSTLKTDSLGVAAKPNKAKTAVSGKTSRSKTRELYSRDALAGLAPTTEFNTAIASHERYVPMLPVPKEAHAKRQLILDTETTGLEALNGDRIIEIGIVEVVNRRFSGEKLHVYINPERDMDAEAVAVHGIAMAFLADKPVFADIGEQVMDFLDGGEIIAHNAPFDMGFLDMEFKKLGINDLENRVSVIDSLAVAKSHYPGQKNSLDALVRRLEIITKDRTFHGALLDAEILADVYLAMTGGQVSLSLGETSASRGEHKQFASLAAAFALQQASAEDTAAHKAWLEAMDGEERTFSARW